MTQMDIQRIKKASGCSELWEVVSSYVGYRPGPDGEGTEMTIAVLKNDKGLWRVEAEDEAGRMTRCNPDLDFNTVLATVHWDLLDTEDLDVDDLDNDDD
jgi:hypothetical protein